MTCKVVENKKDIEMFISLPNKLYEIDNTRDKATEIKLLEHKHILSNNFELKAVIILNEKDKIIGRCAVTIYENDDNLYFGLFDIVSSKSAMSLLFRKIEEIGKINNKKHIIGPIDCSFWIGYRLNINNFNNHYTGEPYNKDYYKSYLENVGFRVIENYSSNRYRVPRESDLNIKYEQRLNSMIDKGYRFIHPNIFNFNRHMERVYDLLTKLYREFPYYKDISKDNFIDMFNSLKYILNFKMVYLVYKDNELKGFMINIPNYKYLTYNLNIGKLLKVILTKYKIKDYVLLYMGVDNDSLGLGSALAELTKRDLSKYKYTSIGALIHDNKVSGSFYKELIEEKYNYVLMGKDI